MWSRLKVFIGERLSEASTLRAITLLAGLAGYTLSPEHGELIATLVVFGLGLFGIMPDKAKTEGQLLVEAEAVKKAKLAEAEEFVRINKET
jgi:energy-converting hydrogenase Eha subunit B